MFLYGKYGILHMLELSCLYCLSALDLLSTANHLPYYLVGFLLSRFFLQQNKTVRQIEEELKKYKKNVHSIDVRKVLTFISFWTLTFHPLLCLSVSTE